MKCFFKIFIAGGVFCLFLFNSKAMADDLGSIFPFDDDLFISQNGTQVLERHPVTTSSAISNLPSSSVFPSDAIVLPEVAAVSVERNEEGSPVPQAATPCFLPLLEMGDDVIIEAFRWASASTRVPECYIRYEKDRSILFIDSKCNISLDDNYSSYQYFIVATNSEEAILTFNKVEKFKREKYLNLPNQIKIVLFNLWDGKMTTALFDDLYSVVPKKNIVSFVLANDIMSSCCVPFKGWYKDKDSTLNFHWKKCPGIRVMVPLSEPKLFTKEILGDIYRRVLRQWHSRIDTIDLGAFRNESEAADGMLDVIGQPPPSTKMWGFLRF